MATREELIKKALLDQVGNRAELFSSEELLTAAGVSEKEVEAFSAMIQQNATQISIDSAGRCGKGRT